MNIFNFTFEKMTEINEAEEIFNLNLSIPAKFILKHIFFLILIAIHFLIFRALKHHLASFFLSFDAINAIRVASVVWRLFI